MFFVSHEEYIAPGSSQSPGVVAAGGVPPLTASTCGIVHRTSQELIDRFTI